MVLVYLSPVSWNSIAQRPHFFVKTALACGFDSVVWVEPTASRLPKWNDLYTKVRNIEADSFDKPCNIDIVSPGCIPVEPFGIIYDIVNYNAINGVIRQIESKILGQNAILVIGKPSRLANSLIRNRVFNRTVFDVMDDYPFFFSGLSSKSVFKNMMGLINQVDICLFSSSALMENYGIYARQKLLVLNACDDDFCAIAANKAAKKESLNKVYGYIGSIASWFDWDVVIKLANENPLDRVILVGPNYAAKIPRLPANIELRGAVPHSEVAEIMSTFDYGIIPFKINKLTESVDPVKFYEYQAYGLSIISTPFGEMTYRITTGVVADFHNYRTFRKPANQLVATWSQRFSEVISRCLNATL